MTATVTGHPDAVEHARFVLGLASPAARLSALYQTYLASPVPPQPGTFQVWTDAQRKALFGVDAPDSAWTKVPTYRRLLAFGWLGFSRSDLRLPEIGRNAPLPKTVQKLEDGFLAALLAQIDEHATSAPAFAARLAAAERELDDLVAALVPADQTPAQNTGGGLGDLGHILEFVAVLWWVTDALTSKKK